MDVEKYIAALEERKAATACDALLHPAGRDAFEYGLASGKVQGLQAALDILQEQQDGADGKARPVKQLPKRNPYSAELDRHPLLPEEM